MKAKETPHPTGAPRSAMKENAENSPNGSNGANGANRTQNVIDYAAEELWQKITDMAATGRLTTADLLVILDRTRIKIVAGSIKGS